MHTYFYHLHMLSYEVTSGYKPAATAIQPPDAMDSSSSYGYNSQRADCVFVKGVVGWSTPSPLGESE